MNQQSQAPGAQTLARAPAVKPLLLGARASRVLLWLVATAWVLLLLTWGALHAVIVPRINDWRPELERWASLRVGVPVTVGDIRSVSGASGPLGLPPFMPQIELRDVRLLDRQGRAALHLPLVQAAVSVRSIWRAGFEQLVIERPALDIRRTADGRLEVAGIDVSGPGSGDTTLLDWLVEQRELAILGGTVRWLDEQRAQPPLALGDVNFVARNTTFTHQFRLDATPPPEWGERFSLRAKLREPLLPRPRATGDLPWATWDGEVYADLGRADVSHLRAYVDLSPWGVTVQSGQGRLRAWMDVARGRVGGGTLDLALQDVITRLGPELPELALVSATGRVSGEWADAGWRLSTQDLRFETREGAVWPGGRVSVAHQAAQTRQAASTEVQAGGIELGALASLAERLPLPATVHDWLHRLQPKGRVDELEARWPGEAFDEVKARGRVVGLGLVADAEAAVPPGEHRPPLGRPGVEAATVDFKVEPNGGEATVAIDQGAVVLPGVFEEARLPLDTFRGRLRWRRQGERIDATLDDARLANADAAGTVQANWHTGDPATSASRSRFPGVLDLTATLERADLTRVHRYLPLSVPPEARHYVRDAVRGGHSDAVSFRVQGDLWQVPFDASGARGTFRIAGPLKALDFDYLPTTLQTTGEPAWPGLRGASGQFVLDRDTITIDGLKTSMAGLAGVSVTPAKVSIERMGQGTTVKASLRATGPGAELLKFVQASPLNDMTSKALDKARLGGAAQVDVNLTLPVMNLPTSTVRGAVQLAGNDVQITPDSPLLARARGTVNFTETGFTVPQAQARLFGGDASFSGGMKPNAQGVPVVQFRGQGVATADGLRNAGLGVLSRAMARATGSATYTAQLGFTGGVPELQVATQLQGMALALPAPLGKSAEALLPVRYDSAITRLQAGQAQEDRLSVLIGPPSAPLADVRYERDLRGDTPRVLRGSLAVGLAASGALPLPSRGVVAHAQLPALDADAWQAALGGAVGMKDLEDPQALDYLPQSLSLQTERLTVAGRQFHQVLAGLSRDDRLWRGNVDAQELNGYIEFRDATASHAGSVYARLARLNLAPGARREVEQLLQQPTSVPALDIAVEDLNYAGRSLGRVEVQAVNRAGPARVAEWRLTQLRAVLPEARLSGSGNWAPLGAQDGPSMAAPGARRTALTFRLDVDDAGKLLERFGRAGTVRGGNGRLEGTIGWMGSPLSLDYATLGGQLQLNIERGQFLKADPGAARLLGVLSLQALPRRLALDFRDVFSEGFAFDFVRGNARIEQGVLTTNNLQMKGVNAAVLMEGSADLAREQQDLKVVVVPEINAGTASLLATAINPAVGLGSFLAQWLLRQPLQSATTQEFRITGGWADPQVEKVVRPAPNPSSSPSLQ